MIACLIAYAHTDYQLYKEESKINPKDNPGYVYELTPWSIVMQIIISVIPVVNIFVALSGIVPQTWKKLEEIMDRPIAKKDHPEL